MTVLNFGKYYIIHKYTPDQARQLKSKGEITFDVVASDHDDIIFAEDEDNKPDDYIENNGLFNNTEINVKGQKLVNNEKWVSNPNKKVNNDIMNDNDNDDKSEESDDDNSEKSNDNNNKLSCNPQTENLIDIDDI